MTSMIFKVKQSEPKLYRFWNDKQWRYDTNPYEKLEAKNKAIMATLFNWLLEGKINIFYLKDNTHFKAYHMSTKEDGAVQLSIGFYRDGKLIPCSDVQLHSVKEMEREGYPHGIWEARCYI